MPYYLYILSFNPHKNLKRLINATSILEVGILSIFREGKSLAQGHRGVSVQDWIPCSFLKLLGKCPWGIITAVILYSLLIKTSSCLDQNKIFRIPYLQQVQLQDGSEIKPRAGESPETAPIHAAAQVVDLWGLRDDQPDYTILPMKKDVGPDRL